MKFSQKTCGLVLAATVATLGGVDSQAVPTIKISTGAGIYTFIDGVSDALADGVVSGLVLTDANFSVAISSLITKPADGSSSEPVLQASVIYTARRAATLSIWFSENDFGPVGVTLESQVTGIFASGADATVMGTTFYDTSNASGLMPTSAGGMTFLLSGPTGPLLPPDGQFIGTASIADQPSPYTLVGFLQVTTSGRTTGGAQLSIMAIAVPDGGSTVAFLGMALVAVEGVRRKFAKA